MHKRTSAPVLDHARGPSCWCRFPAVGAVRKQVQALVRAHAGDSRIQSRSEAFPWLAFGGSSPSLPDSALQFWAPAALLQACACFTLVIIPCLSGLS